MTTQQLLNKVLAKTKVTKDKVTFRNGHINWEFSTRMIKNKWNCDDTIDAKFIGAGSNDKKYYRKTNTYFANVMCYNFELDIQVYVDVELGHILGIEFCKDDTLGIIWNTIPFNNEGTTSYKVQPLRELR